MAVLACLVFGIVAAALFRWLPPRRAILATYLGGLLLLPVGRFPVEPLGGGFPWWITGTAVPSSMLLVKSWGAALAALVGGVLVDPASLRRCRPAAIDLAMLGWCLWPLAGWVVGTARPSPLVSAAYLAGTWGMPWLIGRIWFQERAAQLDLAAALGIAALACLPFALVEGGSVVRLYELVYGTHPFARDGIERYVGYRPLAFFEDGNQYGIWVAAGALASVWLAMVRGGGWRVVAGIALVLALAAQSVGALLLLGAALVVLAGWRARWLRAAAVAGLLLVALAGAVHLSGIVPLQSIVRETRVGNELLAVVRSTGRGSIAWRVSQDTRTLASIHEAPLTGAQRWDWFRPYGTRPWGLAMLVLGQFGLVGLALALGTLATAALTGLARMAGERPWQASAAALPLGLVVLMALGDAVANSFFYFPAILCAGAIAERSARARHADAAASRAAGAHATLG